MSELVVSGRDALAKALFETSSGYPWGETHRMVKAVFYKQADALLASGVVRPLPDEETVARVIGNELSAAGLNLDGAPYSDDGHGNYWPIARELRDGLARAVLALFTEGAKE